MQAFTATLREFAIIRPGHADTFRAVRAVSSHYESIDPVFGVMIERASPVVAGARASFFSGTCPECLHRVYVNVDHFCGCDDRPGMPTR